MDTVTHSVDTVTERAVSEFHFKVLTYSCT